MSEKLYIELIKEMNKNEISVDNNKISKKVKTQSLKILHYDVILDEKHFYLKAQDKGTCTWHATFIADIFFNYYYPTTPVENLAEIYQKKRQDFFQLLKDKKFDSFHVDNLNLRIIQNINLDTFKQEIINFYQKDNVKYDGDVFQYLYNLFFRDIPRSREIAKI